MASASQDVHRRKADSKDAPFGAPPLIFEGALFSAKRANDEGLPGADIKNTGDAARLQAAIAKDEPAALRRNRACDVFTTRQSLDPPTAVFSY